MIRDRYLDINKIISDPEIWRLFRAVEAHGGVIRFVGGCVRDTIKGLSGFDIDLATDLSPDELVEACQERDIKTVPIGIKFGTIGVVLGNNVLEVTSLRKDIKTDGRHAEVEFTDNWEEDAARRDLTINAVYADAQGNVFDYYNGIDDLEKGIVRFIGNPQQRIQEDYLRILRFFRFYSIFGGKNKIDDKALKACIKHREGIKNLAIERIKEEIKKILVTPNAVKTLKIMAENNILEYCLPKPKYIDRLEKLINICSDINLAVPNEQILRFFIMYWPDTELAENLALRLKMTKKHRQTFVQWASQDIDMKDILDEKSCLHLIYKYGKEFCINKLLLLLAYKKKSSDGMKEIIERILSTEVPIFPLRGKDILDHGIDTNIGETLERLRNTWENSNFKLCREELLSML